jgi:hypothetical protein
MALSRLLVVGLVLALALAPAHGARTLKQGGYGVNNGLATSVIDSGYSGTSSIGAIEGDERSGSSQAAAYARGVTKATGMNAYGLQVAFNDEGGSGGAHAAADAIRQQAGYQGSSVAGQIFTESRSGGSSPAEDAIRRTAADNAMVQDRIASRAARYSSSSPFDI